VNQAQGRSQHLPHAGLAGPRRRASPSSLAFIESVI
jgi:hypothetical protein